jgi:hypothetical protein
MKGILTVMAATWLSLSIGACAAEEDEGSANTADTLEDATHMMAGDRSDSDGGDPATSNMGTGDGEAIPSEGDGGLDGASDSTDAGSEEIEPVKVEKSCCDRCYEADNVKPGGRVCCCDEDGDGKTEKKACVYGDKHFPKNKPTRDLMNKCWKEHEDEHIKDGEGTCKGIADGKPSVWKKGEDAKTAEPDQYAEEIDCLKKSKCPDKDKHCENAKAARIKQMEEALKKFGTCAEHCTHL